MQRFNNLSLLVKLNLALIIIFLVVAVLVGGALTRNVNQFAGNVSESRFDEETGVIQQQMVQAQELAIADTAAVANLPQITEAIENEDFSRLSTLIGDVAPTYRFDHIDVINAEGKRIFDTEMTASEVEDEHDSDMEMTDHEDESEHDFLGDNEFIQSGLNGDNATSLVVDHSSLEGAPEVLLATVSPVRNDAGDIVGAIFTGRVIDEDFLAGVNFDRSDVHIGFIFDGLLVARHVAPAGHHSSHPADSAAGSITLAGIDIDSDLVAEAAGGDVVYAGVVHNENGIPHAVGLVPTKIGDEHGSMVVEINLERVGTFQADTISNMALIFGGLGILSIGALALILHTLIIRRLSQLRQAAGEMAAGRYDKPMPVQAQDEIGELGTAFNTLAAEVQQRERELQDINQTLEQRVKARTAELEVATREALEATRLKDEFLSVMSHELRTPLNAIMGYQGLMLMAGQLDEKNKNKVERTLANADRLLSLINDVLDISRIEAQRMEFVPVDINLNDFATKVRTQMQVLADEKKLDFAINVADTVPSSVRVDEDALFKVTNNLLSNAFKFTDQGKVSMDVGFEENSLTITVSDSGIGIPIHMQEVIFEKFRQVDQSSRREYGGSGLGLSIVQQIVHAVGGTINVTSTPGEGSFFTARIPVEVVPETA